MTSCWQPEGDRLAVIDDLDAVADAHHDSHVVFDKHDRQVKFVADLFDQADEVLLFGRIHAGGGFVEQQQLRPCRKCPDDLETPLVAVWQAGAALVLVFFELKDSQQLQREIRDAPASSLKYRGRRNTASTNPCFECRWHAVTTLSNTVMLGNSRMF